MTYLRTVPLTFNAQLSELKAVNKNKSKCFHYSSKPPLMTPIRPTLLLRKKQIVINVKLVLSLWDFKQTTPQQSDFPIKILIACYKLRLERKTSKCEQQRFQSRARKPKLSLCYRYSRRYSLHNRITRLWSGSVKKEITKMRNLPQTARWKNRNSSICG